MAEHKSKARKRPHEEARSDSDDEKGLKGKATGKNEHAQPLGPSGYREDENELQVDLEEYKKDGKV